MLQTYITKQIIITRTFCLITIAIICVSLCIFHVSYFKSIFLCWSSALFPANDSPAPMRTSVFPLVTNHSAPHPTHDLLPEEYQPHRSQWAKNATRQCGCLSWLNRDKNDNLLLLVVCLVARARVCLYYCWIMKLNKS